MRDIFDDVFDGQPQSPTFRSILYEVFGDEYPDQVDPCGFLTKTDLANLVRYLCVGKGRSLIDLACGRGGAGLWVARETGANLTGVDLSSVAVRQATGRIASFGMEGRARFQVGDFARTNLPDASFDAAMSIDALYLVADKTGSVQESARILKPGGRFVFTTWDVNLPGMIRDHRPILESNGLAVQHYETTPDWENRQRSVHELVLAKQDRLIREMGEPSARFWIAGAQTELPRLSRMRRVLVAAVKKPAP
jgi:ubiquinone/menaquinone biosynthesis C-methylase UbiE